MQIQPHQFNTYTIKDSILYKPKYVKLLVIGKWIKHVETYFMYPVRQQYLLESSFEKLKIRKSVYNKINNNSYDNNSN